LQKDWYESKDNWHSFNDFFARRLEDPSARPIAAPDDAAVVAAPADSVAQGLWKVDAESNILGAENQQTGPDSSVVIKSKAFNSVNFSDGVEVGDTVKKGDELGYFLFGGPDFILIFQEGVAFDITVPTAADGSYEHVLMGEGCGAAWPEEAPEARGGCLEVTAWRGAPPPRLGEFGRFDRHQMPNIGDLGRGGRVRQGPADGLEHADGANRPQRLVSPDNRQVVAADVFGQGDQPQLRAQRLPLSSGD
ncbi:MAG: phosphatidylserine decarboxylase, partial [Bifidobacteriaceae bacterium]|nr:phosphatidylserine decarboxylase [Bifidobacteriaceae bacterium]